MARVTVINDNAEFLELMREILEGDSYDTTTVDGDEPTALQAVRASHPDLLIIDLRMGPDEMHGWEVAQQVRADPEMQQVPILICSADLRALHELESELAHAHDVRTLVKPFSIDELTGCIEAMLAPRAAG